MMILNSSNYEDDNTVLLDFIKQYDGNDVVSEDALGIPSSVVEEASLPLSMFLNHQICTISLDGLFLKN